MVYLHSGHKVELLLRKVIDGKVVRFSFDDHSVLAFSLLECRMFLLLLTTTVYDETIRNNRKRVMRRVSRFGKKNEKRRVSSATQNPNE
mmetsp:Transcript_20702/g.43303  ORF Transcript_20702/g.43303 Transcript_20702/m.43303 type:complete len:89 (+) Transcript_20702:659-925(+)